MLLGAVVATGASAQQTAQQTAQPDPLDFEPVQPSFYVGLFGGLGVIHDDASITPRIFTRKGTFPQQASFTTADGLGLTAGLLLEYPFSRFFSVGARVGYQDRSAPFSQQYVNTADVRSIDGTPQSATVEGHLATTLGYVNGTPYLKISPLSFPLYAVVGPTVLIPMTASYTLDESVVSPRGSVYRENGKATRSLASGDLTSASTVFGMTAGVGLDLGLSDRLGLFVEANYSPTFSDVMTVSGGSWTTTALSGIVGLRYGIGNARPTRQIPPPPPVLRDTVQVASRRNGSIGAGAVTPNGLTDTLTVTRRSIQATEAHALLPYIFFDQDSAVIPVRYVQLTTKTRTGFQMERIPRGNTLGVYYQLLNVIGQRMREDRKATVTLTGCTGQFEHGDTVLSRRRAEAVRDYLVHVWRLQPKRITIAPRLLPANPSLSEVDTVEGSRENQRVEISSDNYAILGPVMLPDTSILQPVGTIRFLPRTSDTVKNLDSWSLDIRIGDSVVKDAVTGNGPVPPQIDYTLESRSDLDLRTPVEVSSTLVLHDTAYEELAHMSSQPVVIRQEGNFEEIHPMVNGHYLDRYNLLLFSFDSAGVLDFTQQATSIMRNRITASSIVRVIGHTDRIGLPSYNQKLSERRAETAAGLLGLTPKEVIGMGEKELLYDNTFPEGRYYSRTVTVEIETPAVATSVTGAGTIPTTARQKLAERNN